MEHKETKQIETRRRIWLKFETIGTGIRITGTELALELLETTIFQARNHQTSDRDFDQETGNERFRVDVKMVKEILPRI